MSAGGAIHVRFAAALLAGGKSSRMGRDKALLDWQGKPLWRVQLDKLIALNPERLLLSRRADQDFRTLLADEVVDPPGNPGPLGAVVRCLEMAQTGDGDACNRQVPLLVLAVDMPRMTVAFLQSMIDECGGDSRGLICRAEGGIEPLCAIYPPGAFGLMRDALREGMLRIRTVAERLVAAGLMRVRDLMPDEVPLFFNANTPEEYAWMTPVPPSST